MSIESIKFKSSVEGSNAILETEGDVYTSSLKEAGLDETTVRSVRKHDRQFVADFTKAVGKEAVNVFKKHKDVDYVGVKKINMLEGNSLEVGFDRERSFTNPKSGEEIVHNGYSTVKVKDSAGSNSQLRSVRDEIMAEAKKSFGK